MKEETDDVVTSEEAVEDEKLVWEIDDKYLVFSDANSYVLKERIGKKNNLSLIGYHPTLDCVLRDLFHEKLKVVLSAKGKKDAEHVAAAYEKTKIWLSSVLKPLDVKIKIEDDGAPA